METRAGHASGYGLLHSSCGNRRGIVYVGGEIATRANHDDCILMAYDTRFSQWHCLSPCSARYFSVTVISNKLVLVGGYFSRRKYSSELGNWQTYNKQWTQPFHSMPTARSETSSTCYKHWLTVSGGKKVYYSVNAVEILDVTTSQWSTKLSIPFPWYSVKSVVVDNTWYLMGGDCENL